MSSPLISLIVPTRERCETLVHTLSTATAQNLPDYEIIVSDNASADGTGQVVAENNDPRIQYLRSDVRLSMCDNYEFAVSKARGRYVTIIGDDDGVIPGAIDRLANAIRSHTVERVITWPLHIYDWPVGNLPAHITYLAPSVPEHIIDLKQRAQRAMRLGSWKYYELPSPYHSAIPRVIIDAIRRDTGRVFHSTQPDVFTAMAIPNYADSALNLGKTITFNGRSSKSNGLGFVTTKAAKNIDQFIREYGNYTFHPTLYPAASPRANMIPDAALLAADMFPDLYKNTPFGYSEMWAYVCRLGFARHQWVLANRKLIAERHPLDIKRFLASSIIHEGASVRRTILNRFDSSKRRFQPVPNTVSEFAAMLDQSKDLATSLN
jgi:glycosyltransferase involved in cell wall biosynthesis